MNLLTIYTTIVTAYAHFVAWISIITILLVGVAISGVIAYFRYKYFIQPVQKRLGLQNSIISPSTKQALALIMPKHKTLGLMLGYLFIAVFFVIAVALELLIVPQNPSSPPPAISNASLLSTIATLDVPGKWSKPQTVVEDTYYGRLTGESIQTIRTSDQELANIAVAETIHKYLSSNGFDTDYHINDPSIIEADKNSDTNQIIIFYSQTQGVSRDTKFIKSIFISTLHVKPTK